MRPRDWFIVGLRLIGVWIFVEMIDELRIVLLIAFHLWVPAAPYVLYGSHAVELTLISLYLLFGADQIAKMFFGKDPEPRGFEIETHPREMQVIPRGKSGGPTI